MALRHFRDSSHLMFLVYERKQHMRNCDFNLLIAIVSPENHSQSELAALFSTWKSVHWAVLMSQTWAPVSEEPGYTYHCNCRQRCGPLTPQSALFGHGCSQQRATLPEHSFIPSTHWNISIMSSFLSETLTQTPLPAGAEAPASWTGTFGLTHSPINSNTRSWSGEVAPPIKSRLGAWIMRLPGRHGDVVESEPCCSEGAFRSLLVVVFLLLNRAVLLAGSHGTGGQGGEIRRGADSWGGEGGGEQRGQTST